MKFSRYKSKAFAVCVALFVLCDSGWAANFNWFNSNGNWSAGANWGGAAPSGTDASDSLTFGGSVAAPYLSTNDIAATPFQLDQLIINATDPGATGASHTIAGSALRFMNPASQIVVNDAGSVTLNTPVQFADNATLTVAGAGSGTVTLNGGVTSFGDIFKSGSLVLRFGTLPVSPATIASSSNRWIGRLQATAGTVRFNNNAQSGSTALRSNPVMLSAGAVLSIKRDNGDQVGNYDTSLRIGALSGSGTVLATVVGTAGQNIDNYDILITTLSDPQSSGVFDGLLILPGAFGTGSDPGKLAVRGTGTQTLSGTVNINKDVVVGRGATLKFSGNASLASQTTNGAIIFNGGTFVLDNTANNFGGAGRLRDGSATSSGAETIGGGTLSLIGNASGTSEMTGRLQLGSLNAKLTGGTESNPRSGHLNISLTHNAGSSASTDFRFQSYARDQSTLQQFATVDFSAKNGAGSPLTLGNAGNNPHIFLSNGQFFVPTNGGGLLDATSGTASTGWATVNGTDFATYDTTLGVKAVSTNVWSASLTANSNASLTNSALTPAANYTVNSIRIAPSAPGQSLSIASAGNLICTAFLLAGATDYTISAASTGGIAGGSARFFHVEKATLNVSASLAPSPSAQPVVKSGAGTLVLTNAGNASLPNPVVINEGIVRATPGSSLPSSEIRLRGGTLEIAGGGTFSRNISFGANSLNWSGVVLDATTSANVQVTTDRGSGGLAAFGADVTLDFNGVGPANIQWEDIGFVRAGHALIFGSKTATHRVTWSDNLSLTDAVSAASIILTTYNAREIRVVDNPNATADSARITGIVSGNAYNDLLKTGGGTLELANVGNTYLGATIVEEGTLLVTGNSSSSFATVVKNGTVLAGNGTVAAIVLESGGSLQPGVNAVGILSASKLLWRSGGVARFDLGATGQSDSLALGAGSLEKNPANGTWAFDFGGGGEAGRTYTLMTFNSTTFSAADFTATNLASGVTGAFSIANGALKYSTNFPPAIIATQPQSQHKNLGQPVTFTVQIQTPGAYTYQWFKGNAPINNATTASYNIAAITANDLATYTVVISNGVTPVTSDDAVLTLNTAPTATAQTVSTNEDVALGIALSGTDADNDPLTYTVVTQPTRGSLSGTPPNLTYTPNLNLNGQDSFTFKANDGLLQSPAATITINVASDFDPITATDDIIAPGVAASVLANDIDPDGTPPLTIESVTDGARGTVTISADKTTLTYAPGLNFFNSDNFTYTVKNAANSTAIGHVTVRIAQPAAYGIVLKNGAVSGEPAGTLFTLIGQPSITADGRTAFSATYRSLDKKKHSGILFGVTPSVLVHEGSAAIGTTLSFSKFANPIVSSVGDISFKASLLAAPKGTANGIWAHDGNAMRLVARQKDSAPGITGAFFSKFSDIALPDDGRVIFTATLGGVSITSDSTLWREDGAGSVALLLREGEMLNVAGSQKTVKTFAVFGPGGKGTLDQRRGFNNTGATLARVSFTDKSSAIIRINSDGSKDTILHTGIGYVEIGTAIASFNLPTFADDGSITVQAKLVAASTSDSVILSRSAAGTLSVTAREGAAIPNLGGAAHGIFSDPVGGDSNRIAFTTKLKLKLGGVTSATDTILWRVNPLGSLQLLARKGLPATGTNGAAFNIFKSFAWTGSGNNGVAFVATLKLKKGVVTAANDTGLWAEGSNGMLYLALREGATVQIGGGTKTLKSFTMLGAVLGSIGQSHSTNFVNGYAALAVFTDNTKGVITVWVP